MIRRELHVITDPRLGGGRLPLEIAEAAFAGGADVVQLRDKGRTSDELLEDARLLVALAGRLRRAVVINDHLDLALAARAQGLHVGRGDLPVDEARRRWPRPGRLGASARTPEAAIAAEAAGADYLGVGPVFGTTTKADAPAAVGVDRIALLSRAVALPLIAIGGIDATNASEAIRAGAAGIAVVSAAVGAADVEAAVAELRAVIDAV